MHDSDIVHPECTQDGRAIYPDAMADLPAPESTSVITNRGGRCFQSFGRFVCWHFTMVRQSLFPAFPIRHTRIPSLQTFSIKPPTHDLALFGSTAPSRRTTRTDLGKNKSSARNVTHVPAFCPMHEGCGGSDGTNKGKVAIHK